MLSETKLQQLPILETATTVLQLAKVWVCKILKRETQNIGLQVDHEHVHRKSVVPDAAIWWAVWTVTRSVYQQRPYNADAWAAPLGYTAQ